MLEHGRVGARASHGQNTIEAARAGARQRTVRGHTSARVRVCLLKRQHICARVSGYRWVTCAQCLLKRQHICAHVSGCTRVTRACVRRSMHAYLSARPEHDLGSQGRSKPEDSAWTHVGSLASVPAKATAYICRRVRIHVCNVCTVPAKKQHICARVSGYTWVTCAIVRELAMHAYLSARPEHDLGLNSILPTMPPMTSEAPMTNLRCAHTSPH